MSRTLSPRANCFPKTAVLAPPPHHDMGDRSKKFRYTYNERRSCNGRRQTMDEQTDDDRGHVRRLPDNGDGRLATTYGPSTDTVVRAEGRRRPVAEQRFAGRVGRHVRFGKRARRRVRLRRGHVRAVRVFGRVDRVAAVRGLSENRGRPRRAG